MNDKDTGSAPLLTARGLVKEARETAAAICEAAMPARQPIEALGTLAAGLAASPALRLA